MRSFLMLLSFISLVSCGGIKTAPQPKMNHLVKVNTTIPPELIGKVPTQVNADGYGQ